MIKNNLKDAIRDSGHQLFFAAIHLSSEDPPVHPLSAQRLLGKWTPLLIQGCSPDLGPFQSAQGRAGWPRDWFRDQNLCEAKRL